LKPASTVAGSGIATLLHLASAERMAEDEVVHDREQVKLGGGVERAPAQRLAAPP
jgi:hypothetical protein